MIRHVSLESLLASIKNFGTVIGPGEYQTLLEAGIMLKSQVPASSAESDRIAYITRSSQVQADLINLGSRLAYIHAMRRLERMAYWGGEVENYNKGNKDDRESMALSLDNVYRDLRETEEALSAVQNMVESLLWSLKTVLQKV